MDASTKPGTFQTVLNFLKTYWVYIVGVIVLYFVARWFWGRSFNPKSPQDCSSCPGGGGAGTGQQR